MKSPVAGIVGGLWRRGGARWPKCRLLGWLLLETATGSAFGVTRYVDVNSAHPAPPYTNWATAAAIIQDAVDAATDGDEVVVTNGIYATGGRALYGAGTNRVAVDKQLTLRSVNGPQFTVIEGYQVPGTTNGDGAIRCVLLGFGASLSGFTLTNGATVKQGAGGGLLLDMFTVVSNCVVVGNSADFFGGGAAGAFNGYGGTLNNCILANNCAGSGGGTLGCSLNNCAITGNSAAVSGGGVFGGTLNNCTITGNSAIWYGGGVSDTGSAGTLVGFEQFVLNNCIVYFNSAFSSPNCSFVVGGDTLNYCCTPLPATNGVGNITADPQLASALYLSANSPCRGAGRAAYASGTDIDGEAWGNPPSIGCDEYHATALTGPLNVTLVCSVTNVAVAYPVGLTAVIDGRTSASVWEFGDGLSVSNQPYTSHAWAAPGDYAIVLRAYNESHPTGVSATVTVHVAPSIYYVAANSTNPTPPYRTWATAATNIQDAVDAVTARGAFVLVTNGVYATGGRAVYGTMTNRVAVDKPITVRSVNGPHFTVIQGRRLNFWNGDGAIRCVYLTNGASLVGFTLTNGATRSAGDAIKEQSGGGLYCESRTAVVSNCVVVGNSAYKYGAGAYGGGSDGADTSGIALNNCTLDSNFAQAGGGGGAYGAALSNCRLFNNKADFGGGAEWASLDDCTLAGNSASIGGGALDCTLQNCIVYSNTAATGPNYYQDQNGGSMDYCCTTPVPTNGVGNITNAPLFVDYLSANLRLQSNSPCINAGSNAYAFGSTDLDGRPRIVGGTVDIGAYESEPNISGQFIGWLERYGLPTDGAADYADTDGDGMNNWQEWRCGTDPTNPLSVLRLWLSDCRHLPDGSFQLTVHGETNHSYTLQISTNLLDWATVGTFITVNGTLTLVDPTAADFKCLFYRLLLP